MCVWFEHLSHCLKLIAATFTMYLPTNLNNLVFVETILYSTFFPKESILFTKAVICNNSYRNVIDLFYMNTTITTEHLIKLVYMECDTPVLLNTFLNKHPASLYEEPKLSTKVLILNSLDQVDTLMEVIDEYRINKDKQKYFVIVESIGESLHQDQWLYYLFVKFWRKQILNVVVIFHKHSVQMYTYQLLADTGCLNANTSMPTALQEKNFNLNLMNITNYPMSRLFFNKLTNLQGRKLMVTMVTVTTRAHPKKDGSSYTGIDGHVADLVRTR